MARRLSSDSTRSPSNAICISVTRRVESGEVLTSAHLLQQKQFLLRIDPRLLPRNSGIHDFRDAEASLLGHHLRQLLGRHIHYRVVLRIRFVIAAQTSRIRLVRGAQHLFDQQSFKLRAASFASCLAACGAGLPFCELPVALATDGTRAVPARDARSGQKGYDRH